MKLYNILSWFPPLVSTQWLHHSPPHQMTPTITFTTGNGARVRKQLWLNVSTVTSRSAAHLWEALNSEWTLPWFWSAMHGCVDYYWNQNHHRRCHRGVVCSVISTCDCWALNLGTVCFLISLYRNAESVQKCCFLIPELEPPGGPSGDQTPDPGSGNALHCYYCTM